MASPAILAQKSVDYLRRNYRYFVDDPAFFWMKTLARFEVARDIAKRTSSVPPPTPLPTQAIDTSHVVAEHGTEGALSTLETDGYYVGLRLSEAALSKLLERLQRATCYAERDVRMPFLIDRRAEAESQHKRMFKLGSYLAQQDEWPEFRAILNDRTLNAIAQTYLGCTPVYIRSELMWSFPSPASWTDKRANAQVFHCDINDFRTLKFFFYLTNVAPGGGPHVYIKKNPRSRTLLHQVLGQRCASIPDEMLEATYGQEQIVTIYGPAGLGFVGDPYYFHRGTTPTEAPRLLLQLEMGARRYRTWYAND